LLVLGFEILQKFVETRVALCHTFDAGVKTLAWLFSLRLDKGLYFFYFCNRLWATGGCLGCRFVLVAEEKHLRFLVAVLVDIVEYL
jgi:hypothetical protein